MAVFISPPKQILISAIVTVNALIVTKGLFVYRKVRDGVLQQGHRARVFVK